MASTMASKNISAFGDSGSSLGDAFTFGEVVAEPTRMFCTSLFAPSFTFGSVATDSPMPPFSSGSDRTDSSFSVFRSGETGVIQEEEAEPEPFAASVKGLFEGELKKRVALALVEALAEKNADIESLKHSLSTEKDKFARHEAKFNKQNADIESLKHSLSTEKEKFARHEAKFNKQNAETIKLRQKVNDNKTSIARYRNTIAYMDMERTRVVHSIRAPTCGDSGGVTQDGYPCQRTSWLDWQGRCRDH